MAELHKQMDGLRSRDWSEPRAAATLPAPTPIESSSKYNDARLKALLEQQALIQAEIKALLPSKKTLNAQEEWIMLEHKHEILKSHQENSNIAPMVMSMEEECRLLQYKCECLEAACLRSGKFPSVKHIFEQAPGSLISRKPEGFETWLHANIKSLDPIFVHNEECRAVQYHPLKDIRKCPESRCIHYVYGFRSSEELEAHKRQYHPVQDASSIDSSNNFHNLSRGPSINNGIHIVDFESRERHDKDASSSTASNVPPHLDESIKAGPPATAPIVHSAKRYFAEDEMPPPNSATSQQMYSFIPVYSNLEGFIRHSTAETDTSQPAKRIKIVAGPHMETNLSREVGPCLRCKILKKKCNTEDPCSLCPEQDNSAEHDYWRVLGCHRGSLTSFAELLAPVSFVRLRASHQSDEFLFNQVWWNDFQTCNGLHGPSSSLLRDEFGDLFDVKNKTFVSKGEFRSTLPSAYTLLQTTNKIDSTLSSFDLLDVFRFSVRISGTKELEVEKYPLLFLSKNLLREALILEISNNPNNKIRELFSYDRHSQLHRQAIELLSLFDDMTLRRSSWDPRSWLAAFCSLCFMHVSAIFLNDGYFQMAGEKSGFKWSRSQQIAIHSVYKALVSAFTWSTPSVLEEKLASMGKEEHILFTRLQSIVMKDKWPSWGISSTKDFLMGLGSGYFEDGFYGGFVSQHFSDPPRERRATSHVSQTTALDPISRLEKQNDDTGSKYSKPGIPLMTRQASPYARIGNMTEDLAFQRPKAVFCSQCEDHPEGFRGEHELRRHHYRVHSTMVKKWVCVQPEGEGHPQPYLPLSKCKSCGIHKKKYGAYYNAAAHLRRTHFRPKDRSSRKNKLDDVDKRGGKGGGDWPPMSELKHWMKEIEEPAPEHRFEQQQQDEAEVSDEDAIIPETLMSSRDTPTTTSIPPIPPSSRIPNPNFVPQPDRWTPGPAASEDQHRCPYPECGRQFTDLKAHMLTHQNERPEKCPLPTCEYHIKGFARKYDKNRHTLSHYSGTLVCPFCPGVDTPAEKTFSRADVLKRHLTSAHGVNPVVGPLGAGGVLGGQMLGRTEADTKKKGKCSICGKFFDGPQEFHEHLEDCVLAVIAPAAIAGTAQPGRLEESASRSGSGSADVGSAQTRDVQMLGT